MKHYTYVLDINGNPLMPTLRHAKVRKLLKEKKVIIVDYKPFTIKLMYESTIHIQPVHITEDPGRTNIGISAIREDGTCLFFAKVETRNKKIPSLMAERKAHRIASRSGERKRRQRRAKKNNTIFKESEVREKVLPQCEEPIKIHYINNSEAKFCNRKRPEGWLTPTAKQLLLTHINVIKKISTILPATHCNVELNKFSFMKMENPNIRNWEYQKGKLFGYSSVEEAIYKEQNGKCLLCNKNIEHYHHIVEKTICGSNTMLNIAGLCEHHHNLVHKSKEWKAKLKETKEGIYKQYNALSIVNQIIPFLLKELQKIFGDNLSVCTGLGTKEIREKYNIPKDHHLDAYCIGLHNIKNPVIDYDVECFVIKQYRRHNRQLIHRQTERTYKLNGKAIAKNRQKRIGQEDDSLNEFYLKLKKEKGKKEAKVIIPILKVLKSTRSYELLPPTLVAKRWEFLLL